MDDRPRGLQPPECVPHLLLARDGAEDDRLPACASCVIALGALVGLDLLALSGAVAYAMVKAGALPAVQRLFLIVPEPHAV